MKDVQKIEVVKQASTIASPGPAVTFIFSAYSAISWAVMAGYLGEGAGLMLGIVQVCGAIGFLSCAIVNMVKGNPFGAVNMIFAICFGLFGGVNGICTTYFAAKGIPFDIAVAGIVNLMAGIYVLGLIPVLLSIPLYQFIYNMAAGLGLTILGLAQIFGFGNGWFVLAGWLFLVVGVLGLYHAISETSADCGVNLPQGKPLKS